MASLSAVLASALCVVAGLLTFKHLTESTQEFIDPYIKSCPGEVEAEPIFGWKPLDTFICFATPFFEKAWLNNGMILAGGYLLAIAQPVVCFFYLEASRKRAPMVLTWLPVLAIAEIVLGISVAVPLLWIPAYLLTNAGDRSSKAALEGKAIPVNRVLTVALLNFLPLPGALAMGTTTGVLLRNIITAFQVVPVIQPVLMWPIYGSTKNQAEGHRAVQLLYLFCAGVAFMWHALAIAFVAKDPSILHNFIALFTHHPGLDAVTYFFVVDCTVTWAATLFFVLIEDGIVQFALTTLGSVVIGPAALALYFASREGAIASAAAVAKSGKKTQ